MKAKTGGGGAGTDRRLADARAVLRVWAVAVQVDDDEEDEHGRLESAAAGIYQTALLPVIDALQSAVDDAVAGVDSLPLHEAISILQVVDRALCGVAYYSAEIVPERADLVGAIDLALAALARFDAVSAMPVVAAPPVASSASPSSKHDVQRLLARIRTAGLSPRSSSSVRGHSNSRRPANP